MVEIETPATATATDEYPVDVWQRPGPSRVKDSRGHAAVAGRAANGAAGQADPSVVQQEMLQYGCMHLRTTHLPVNQSAVELADDEARKRGRRRIRENKSGPKVETLRPGELKLARTNPANPLK